MRVEVDQSGKMEVLTVDTALAFSDGIASSILVPAAVKREAYHTLKARGTRPKLIGFRMFAAGLYILLNKYLDQITVVVIDVEYDGWEGMIKGLLVRHIAGRRPEIGFWCVGKKSPAHSVAWLTYRGKRKPDVVVTAHELLKYC